MECFAGMAKPLVGVLKGIPAGVNRLRGRDRTGSDPLVDDAGKKPKKTLRNGSTTVSEVAVDESLQAASKPPQGSVLHKPANKTIVEGYAESLADVSSQLESVCQHAQVQGLTQPHQTRLKQLASTHVDAVTCALPVAFGMQSDAIKKWLLEYDGDASSIASALKTYLTTQLVQSGHGAQAADWLYQQVLSAGSTCLASRSDNPEQQTMYLKATAQEVRQLAVTLKAPDAIQRLIESWNQGSQAGLANEKVRALQQAVSQGKAPDSDLVQTPSHKKANELEVLSFEADQDAAETAHQAFMEELNNQIAHVRGHQIDSPKCATILDNLLRKLEDALKAKLFEFSDPSTAWSTIRNPSECPDWKALRDHLGNTRSERYICAWALLTHARGHHAEAADELGKVLTNVKGLCTFEESIEKWDQLDSKRFSDALEIIRSSQPPSALNGDLQPTRALHRGKSYSSMVLDGDSSSNAEEVQPPPTPLKLQGKRRKIKKAPSSDRNPPPPKTGGDSGSVSEKEPLELGGGPVNLTKKKQKKPKKTVQGKQPKPEQLPGGDGKQPVGPSQGPLPATKHTKNDIAEQMDKAYAKVANPALAKFSNGMDEVVAKLQDSPPTEPESAKKETPRTPKLKFPWLGRHSPKNQ